MMSMKGAHSAIAPPGQLGLIQRLVQILKEQP
jgi:hypothetical protein